MITITFINGTGYVWEKECYTDYKYDGKTFLIYYDEKVVGIYNTDCVASIVIK